MTALKNQVTDIEQPDVMFVITVPAIWSDAAKQFMREAAIAVRMVLIITDSVKVLICHFLEHCLVRSCYGGQSIHSHFFGDTYLCK